MTPADIAAFTPPADHLAGRIILVTGATKGIGRALALGLSAHGATVILSGRSQKKLEKVYDEVVTAGGPTPAMLPLDLENALASHYDAAAEAIGSEFGRRLDAFTGNDHRRAQMLFRIGYPWDTARPSPRRPLAWVRA